MSATNGVRLQGRKQGWPHWTTPKLVLDAVRDVGPIILDPCSNDASQVGAITNWQSEGTEFPWLEPAHGGLVFVNPPYNDVKEFVKKCIIEGRGGVEIILLVAARMETKWTHACLQNADALCFWEGRIAFENPPPDSEGKNPSIPSVFYYWGRNRRLFMQSMGKHGFVVDLRSAPRKTFPVHP